MFVSLEFSFVYLSYFPSVRLFQSGFTRTLNGVFDYKHRSILIFIVHGRDRDVDCVWKCIQL